MSGVYTSIADVDNFMIAQTSEDFVHDEILQTALLSFSPDIKKHMTITKVDKLEISSTEYHVQVAILTAEEFDHLKKVEEQYEKLRGYINKESEPNAKN